MTFEILKPKKGLSSSKDLSLMTHGNFMVCIDLMDLNWYSVYMWIFNDVPNFLHFSYLEKDTDNCYTHTHIYI